VALKDGTRGREEHCGKSDGRTRGWGLWRGLEEVRRACCEAEKRTEDILGSATTAAYSGLHQWEILPHRELILEVSARSLPSCALFLDVRDICEARQPECRLLLFSDLLVLRGQALPDSMRISLSTGWVASGGRLQRSTSDTTTTQSTTAASARRSRVPVGDYVLPLIDMRVTRAHFHPHFRALGPEEKTALSSCAGRGRGREYSSGTREKGELATASQDSASESDCPLEYEEAGDGGDGGGDENARLDMARPAVDMALTLILEECQNEVALLRVLARGGARCCCCCVCVQCVCVCERERERER
jgi:hypothetical protein